MGKLIQIENSAVNIALSLREQFKRQNICITDEFITPVGKVFISGLWWMNGWIRKGPSNRQQMLFREISPGDSFFTLSLPGHEVQFVQAVKVRLSTPAQLEAAGQGLPQATQEMELHLIFNLRVQVTTVDVLHSTNEVVLGIAFAGIEGLPDIPGLIDLRQRIAGMFPSRRIPLNVSSLTRFESGQEISNAGIAITVPGPVRDKSDLNIYASVGQTIVGIRIEVGAPPVSKAPWETFLAGEAGATFIDGADGQIVDLVRSWYLFRDAHFVAEEAKHYMERELQKTSEFELQGGIAATWSNPGGRPTVNLNFFGEAEDLIDVEVDVTVDYSVPKPPTTEPLAYHPGSLEGIVKFDVTKSAWDTFWLELGGWIVNPYFGAFIWGELNQGVPFRDQKCVPAGFNTYVCQEPFDAKQANIGGLPALTGVWGRPDGMVLKGHAHWMRQLSSEYRIASIDVQPFKLDHVRISCGQLGASMLGRINEHPEDFITNTAIVSVVFELTPPEPPTPILPISHSNADRIPPAVCAVRVRPEDDPLNVFAPHVSYEYVPSNSSILNARVKVSVPWTGIPPAYFTDAHRYPCRLLIQTSVGTRVITLPAIQQGDAGAAKTIAMEAWARGVSECYAKSKGFSPTWIIDPSDYYERHFWDVSVAGLRPGEQAGLMDQRGRVVSTVRAGDGGRARLRTFLSPDDYDGRLSFKRSSSTPPTRQLHIQDLDIEADMPITENYLRIDVRQTQFLMQSEIETSEQIVAAAFIIDGARHGLVLAQPSGVIAYDISQPTHPTAAAHIRLPGLSGALSTGYKILAWGNEGIFAVDIDLESGDTKIEHASKAPVMAMTRVGQRFFALSNDHVEVRGQNGHREKIFKVPQAAYLAATSTHLLVGSNSGVKLYRVCGKGCPVLVGEHRIEGLSCILTSKLRGKDCQFVLRGCSKSELIDVSDPERVTVLGDYSDLPEFGLLTRHRNLMVEADKSGMVLRLFSIGTTAFI
jgi:hypothetical protein